MPLQTKKGYFVLTSTVQNKVVFDRLPSRCLQALADPVPERAKLALSNSFCKTPWPGAKFQNFAGSPGALCAQNAGKQGKHLCPPGPPA